MKFSNVATLALVSGLASAQFDACAAQESAVPTCATAAITSAASQYFGCAATDLPCQCSNANDIQLSAGDAIFNDCGDQAFDVANSFAAVCTCVSSVESATDILTTSTSVAVSIPTSPSIGSVPTVSLPTDTGILSIPTVSGPTLPTGTGITVSIPTGSVGTGSSSTPVTGPVGPISVGSGSTSSPGGTFSSSMTIPVFTGAAATANAFLPLGGALGAIIGAVALL